MTKTQLAIAGYVLAAVVTFGHPYSKVPEHIRTTPIGVIATIPAAALWPMYWPLYWSAQAWEDN